MNNKLLIFLIITLFLPTTIFAQNVAITQINPSKLLTYSNIDCYVSVTDKSGTPIENANHTLFRAEHERGNGMLPVKILDIKKNGTSNTKVTFLLVLDNSGSMYKIIGNNKEKTRIEQAKKAIRNFLKDINNSKTRVGIAVFNTRYSLLVEPTNDIDAVVQSLTSIKKPDNENAYTELYYAIDRSAYDMSKYRGRKAVILLSDGQNYPYYKKSGKPNPEIGKKLYTPQDALISLQKEGVTLYGINFSRQKDPSLSMITINSGGIIYDALNSTQLLNVYQNIQDRIAKEYKVTIKAPLVFLEKPKVKIWYQKNSDTKTYFAPSLMGSPIKKPFLLSVLGFIFVVITWILLVIIRFEKPAKQAEISMLKHGTGKPIQRTIALNSNRTVIGNSPKADFTVMGNPKIKGSHAEIIHDKKTGGFTIVSDEEVKVNNRPTKKRVLKPGDVINIEGATIIFDTPEKQQGKR